MPGRELPLYYRVKTHQFLGDDRASSFCDDRKFNDHEREPDGIITLLQEDKSFPEALLAVVTSQVNGNFVFVWVWCDHFLRQVLVLRDQVLLCALLLLVALGSHGLEPNERDRCNKVRVHYTKG